MAQTVKDGSQSLQTKLIRLITLLVVIAIAIIFCYYYFTESNDSLYAYISTYDSMILSGIACILIAIRAITSPAGANSRKAYWGLTLAVFFYFLGETSYALWYTFIDTNVPYPGLGDIFWVVGTIFFIDELFFMVSVIKVKFTKKQLTTIYGLTAIIVVGLILLVFGDVITAHYTSDNTPFVKAMNLFYFTGDILILFATIYIVFGLFAKTGLRLSPKHLSWIFLILGNVSMIIADAIFAYWGVINYATDIPLAIHFGPFFTLQYFYNDYSVDNLLYLFQYVFWAFCFGFFPAYLNRSFTTKDNADEEFVPIEPKKPVQDSTVSSTDTKVSDDMIKSNTLGLKSDSSPAGETVNK